jgi:hypothetical protein
MFYVLLLMDLCALSVVWHFENNTAFLKLDPFSSSDEKAWNTYRWVPQKELALVTEPSSLRKVAFFSEYETTNKVPRSSHIKRNISPPGHFRNVADCGLLGYDFKQSCKWLETSRTKPTITSETLNVLYIFQSFILYLKQFNVFRHYY